MVYFAHFGLVKGDRMAPSPDHPDVLLENHNPTFPIQPVFWPPSAEALCKHRNPSFHFRTVIEPGARCINEMHAMHVGVFQVYVLSVLWDLALASAWGMGGDLPEESVHSRSVLRAIFAAWAYLRWLATTMVNGTFPGQEHDGSPWAMGDPTNALAGSPLRYRDCVLIFKQTGLVGVRALWSTPRGPTATTPGSLLRAQAGWTATGGRPRGYR